MIVVVRKVTYANHKIRPKGFEAKSKEKKVEYLAKAKTTRNG